MQAIKQVMRDFGEYLRAYWVYVSTSLGLGKALAVALMWVGMAVVLSAVIWMACAVTADIRNRPR